MNKLFDLRFVIGLFFSVVGLLLVLYGTLGEAKAPVNVWCGGSFLLFGILMIGFSLKK